MPFVHLHVHTEYSLLDGSNKIKQYVAKVKELGMTAAAITDHGAMYGVIDFYKEARAQGIKPILGCEVYVAPESRFEKEAGMGEERYHHLVLLAENNTGYQNLIKIVSRGFTEGFYYRPRVDKEILKRYHEGIIASSACLAGEIPRFLVRQDYAGAKKSAQEYLDIFGRGNFFLELQDHGIPDQQLVNQQLMRMSHELDIPMIATNDVHYTAAEDAEAHDVLLCIQTNAKVQDEDRMRYEGGQYYVKSQEEMETLFPYAKEALLNTEKIAERCNVEIEFGVTKLPKYDVPDGKTSWEYLNELCGEGLVRRYGEPSQELWDRLHYELGVIRNMGYVDYFLIVWDFIHFAKSRGIMVGPGRGSAAGSVVSYCLEITNIDPEKYQLLFERFLNPERVSMPDIDIDFCYVRRQEVIDYVSEKYGKDCVSQIITFGTLQARGVVRDVTRAMDLPYAFGDNIAKKIPQELGMTLDLAIARNPELKLMYETDTQVKEIIDICRQLEGLPRHASRHAAGVLISAKPVEEYVPLALASDGSLVEQFDMVTLEELGLLKMDFLGLRTLTVIQDAVLLAEESDGVRIDIDSIPMDDQNVFRLIGSGRTDGIFQLESAGMRSFMKELQPESLEDIIAGVALYRPGPMDFIPKYIAGKHNRGEIAYDAPQLKHILEPTYGCIVYQEQVMQIVRDLAGFPMGRSDNLRRAMSKKKGKVMEAEREVFVYGDEAGGIPGCIKNGIPEATANRIYDEMIDFAKYAFNKSHAAAYAVVAYQTAWLKYYYPMEFMAALMTSVIEDSKKVANYIYVCRQMGIPILPPDINKSDVGFSIDTFTDKDGTEKRGIRFALSAIKAVGTAVIEELIRERRAGGPYKSLDDFIARKSDHVNTRAVENFIKAGALDCFGIKRKAMMFMFEPMIKQQADLRKNNIAGQMSLFEIAPEETKDDYRIQAPDVEEYDRETYLAFEKEVMGIYVSGHPLQAYEESWRRKVTATASDFAYDEETGRCVVTDNQEVMIGGFVKDYKPHITKNNKNMAFFSIEDLTGTVEGMLFPRDYERFHRFLEDDAKVFVRAHVSEEEEKDAKFIAQQIIPFDQKRKELWIRFADKEAYNAGAAALEEQLSGEEGEDSVVIYLQKEKAIKRLPARQNVTVTEELTDMLADAWGEDQIRVVEKTEI